MLEQNGLKIDKNSKIGEGREHLCKLFLENRWKYIVVNSNFTDDVVNKIDLIGIKADKRIYVQVKGFHDGWKDETFPALIKKAEEDEAIPYVFYVNKLGRIYPRKLK